VPNIDNGRIYIKRRSSAIEVDGTGVLAMDGILHKI
jgi:hypothetical protein